MARDKDRYCESSPVTVIVVVFVVGCIGAKNREWEKRF